MAPIMVVPSKPCVITAQADGSWLIASSAPGRASSTLAFKPVPGKWSIAYHVLEAYNVNSICILYPPPGIVNFTNIRLEIDGTPVAPITWQFDTQVLHGICPCSCFCLPLSSPAQCNGWC